MSLGMLPSPGPGSACLVLSRMHSSPCLLSITIAGVPVRVVFVSYYYRPTVLLLVKCR